MATRLKTPADIAGLIGYQTVTDTSTLVLDGSNGVSQWSSQKGGLTAIQTDSTKRPVFNPSIASIGNKPGLVFNSSARMDFTTPAAFPTGSAAHTVLLLFRGTVSQGNVCILTWGGSTGSWRIFGYGNSGTNAWAALANVGDHSSATSALNATLIEVHTVTAGASPASNHYANGGAANSRSFGGSLVTNNATATLGYTPYLGLNANGVVLEAIAIYDRVLSTADRQDLEGIVAWQHGQQALLVSGHPSAAAAPTIDDGTGAGSVTPDAAAQTNVSTSPTLTPRIATQPNSASQSHVATSPSLAARASALIDSASHSNVATSPSTLSRASVSPDSAAQANVATMPALSVAGSVTPDAAVQSQVPSSPTLTPKAILAPDSAVQAHQATSPALSNVRSVVAPASSYRANAATQPSLGVAGTISVDSASQQQVSTSPTLSARASVTPASAIQANAATSPSIGVRGSLTIDSAANSHAATSPTITARFSVAPASSARSSIATSPTLSAKAALLIASAYQGHFATSPILFVGARPLPPSTRTVRSIRFSRVVRSPRPSRLAA